MAGSVIGAAFRVTAFGESHGAAVGAVIDGCPAGLPLSESDIQPMLNRRKPGGSPYATARSEPDAARLLSGVFNGQTTGAPIAIVIDNTDQRPKDYAALEHVFRPAHADFTFQRKYGLRDHRGGGRSSGRETAARVAAGAVAAKLLAALGVSVSAYVTAIGDISIDTTDLQQAAQNPLCMPDALAAAKAAAFLDALAKTGDSAGGTVECAASGLPAGLGEPVFDKLTAELAKAVCSIGAVKAFEIGAGHAAAKSVGSANNAAQSGGALGGISDGQPLILRAHFKPTPSISRPQTALNDQGEQVPLEIKGRHDPVIAPRAAVVVEAMVCLTLADLLLRNMAANMDNLRKLYNYPLTNPPRCYTLSK